MQTAKTDPNEIYADIHRLLLTTIRGDPNGGKDKVFYLLASLTPIINGGFGYGLTSAIAI